MWGFIISTIKRVVEKLKVGIDCVEISRFSKEKITNTKFLKKIFTDKEIQYCKKKANSSQHFAARFACKEAIIKAISSYDIKIPYNKIEIINDSKGLPNAIILDMKEKKFEVEISLTHSNIIASAVAIITKI